MADFVGVWRRLRLSRLTNGPPSGTTRSDHTAAGSEGDVRMDFYNHHFMPLGTAPSIHESGGVG
jgi:hypothetical protein